LVSRIETAGHSYNSAAPPAACDTGVEFVCVIVVGWTARQKEIVWWSDVSDCDADI